MRFSLIRWIMALGILAGVAVAAQLPWKRRWIYISGSSTVLPFATAVAEHFAMKKGCRIPWVEASGTGGGMSRFCSGNGEATPDIVLASRPMQTDERKLCQVQGVSFHEVIVGLDAVVLLQSPKAEPLNLSLNDLRKAIQHSSKTTLPYFWSDVSDQLPAFPIHVLGPSPASGTQEFLMEKVFDITKGASFVRRDGMFCPGADNQNLTLIKVNLNPMSVGIASFSFFKEHGIKLRMIPINGVDASLDTLNSGEYPLTRPLYLYVKVDHMAALPDIRGYVNAFFEEDAIGPKGYLRKKGLIPLPPQRLNSESPKERN